MNTMPDDHGDDQEPYAPDDPTTGQDNAPETGEQPTHPRPRAAALRRGVLQSRPKMKKPKSVNKGAGRILAKERQRTALELRKSGASYAQIAQAVGYADQGGARKAVLKAFSEIIQEPAVEVRTIQVERLNHMLLTLWPKVGQGDERAIDTSLRVMDKLDRLMGTEAAQSVDINVNQTNAILVIDGSKDDYVNAMKRMAGIQGDGTNRPMLNAAPTAPPSGVIDYEVIEGALVEDDGTQNIDSPYVPTEAPEPSPRRFEFGVEPTITQRTDHDG